MRITDEMIQIAIDNGFSRSEAEKGYVIAVSDDYGCGATHIERIDCMSVFDDDLEAAVQAEKDGVPIIHDLNLPEKHKAAYIDTPSNRELLAALVGSEEMNSNGFDMRSLYFDEGYNTLSDSMNNRSSLDNRSSFNSGLPGSSETVNSFEIADPDAYNFEYSNRDALFWEENETVTDEYELGSGYNNYGAVMYNGQTHNEGESKQEVDAVLTILKSDYNDVVDLIFNYREIIPDLDGTEYFQDDIEAVRDELENRGIPYLLKINEEI